MAVTGQARLEPGILSGGECHVSLDGDKSLQPIRSLGIQPLPQVAGLVLGAGDANGGPAFSLSLGHWQQAVAKPVHDQPDSSSGLTDVIHNSRRVRLLSWCRFWGRVRGRQAQPLPVVVQDFSAHGLKLHGQVELRILKPMLLHQFSSLIQCNTDGAGLGGAVKLESSLGLAKAPATIRSLSFDHIVGLDRWG